MKDGTLYKCKSSTTGESWVSSKWDATQVTDELGGSGGASSLEDLSDVSISSLSVDQALMYDGHQWHNGSPAMNLVSLSDTDITSASNGQVLTYDSTSNKWKNANASGGGSATKFSLYNQSASTAVSFREVSQGSTFKFTVSGTQKDLGDIINAFDNGGAIIVDADTSEAIVNSVINTGQGAFLTIIATCGNGDTKLITFSRTSSKTFNCTLSRSLGS